MNRFDSQSANAIIRRIQEGHSFEVACALAGVPPGQARAWRRLGCFVTSQAGPVAFHTEVLRLEAKVIAKAEKKLVDLAAGEQKGGGTRAEARGHNAQLRAAELVLETWCPERYGKTKRDELNRLRQQAADELLDYLRQRLPFDVFDKVLDALAGPAEPALEAGGSGK